jgi:hypothetical protein
VKLGKGFMRLVQKFSGKKAALVVEKYMDIFDENEAKAKQLQTHVGGDLTNVARQIVEIQRTLASTQVAHVAKMEDLEEGVLFHEEKLNDHEERIVDLEHNTHKRKTPPKKDQILM